MPALYTTKNNCLYIFRKRLWWASQVPWGNLTLIPMKVLARKNIDNAATGHIGAPNVALFFLFYYLFPLTNMVAGLRAKMHTLIHEKFEPLVLISNWVVKLVHSLSKWGESASRDPKYNSWTVNILLLPPLSNNSHTVYSWWSDSINSAKWWLSCLPLSAVLPCFYTRHPQIHISSILMLSRSFGDIVHLLPYQTLGICIWVVA